MDVVPQEVAVTATNAPQPTKPEPVIVNVRLPQPKRPKASTAFDCVRELKWVALIIAALWWFRGDLHEVLSRVSEFEAGGIVIKAEGNAAAVDPKTKALVESLEARERWQLWVWGADFCFADATAGEQNTRGLRDRTLYTPDANPKARPGCGNAEYAVTRTEQGKKPWDALDNAARSLFGPEADKMRLAARIR